MSVMNDERQFRESQHREKVVEHLFLGELLRYLWVARVAGVQVLKPEVDAAGYDLVLSLGKIIRHVQIKASLVEGKARYQPIHEALGAHPSGCVIWILLGKDLSFPGFLWFGGRPGRSLPDLADFKRARHTRGDALGLKKDRVRTWRVPKSAFERVPDMAELVGKLFGRPVG